MFWAISVVNRNDLLKNDYYALGELIGRQGIEKQYETSLRGEKGKEFFRKIGSIKSRSLRKQEL